MGGGAGAGTDGADETKDCFLTASVCTLASPGELDPTREALRVSIAGCWFDPTSEGRRTSTGVMEGFLVSTGVIEGLRESTIDVLLVSVTLSLTEFGVVGVFTSLAVSSIMGSSVVLTTRFRREGAAAMPSPLIETLTTEGSFVPAFTAPTEVVAFKPWPCDDGDFNRAVCELALFNNPPELGTRIRGALGGFWPGFSNFDRSEATDGKTVENFLVGAFILGLNLGPPMPEISLGIELFDVIFAGQYYLNHNQNK